MSKLTKEERDRLPDSDFAIPEAREYPIHNEEHAKAALGEVAANGTPTEKRLVRRAVFKRYPQIDQAQEERRGIKEHH
jgi:hypothetical protein